MTIERLEHRGDTSSPMMIYTPGSWLDVHITKFVERIPVAFVQSDISSSKSMTICQV